MLDRDQCGQCLCIPRADLCFELSECTPCLGLSVLLDERLELGEVARQDPCSCDGAFLTVSDGWSRISGVEAWPTRTNIAWIERLGSLRRPKQSLVDGDIRVRDNGDGVSGRGESFHRRTNDSSLASTRWSPDDRQPRLSDRANGSALEVIESVMLDRAARRSAPRRSSAGSHAGRWESSTSSRRTICAYE